MGKMSEIAFLLETGDEKGLVEFFGSQGWRKSVSEIGGKEFLKAFDEINKDKDKMKKEKIYKAEVKVGNDEKWYSNALKWGEIKWVK